MKNCTVCKEDKPIDEFHFRNKVKGIRRFKCSSCVSAWSKEYRKENRDKILKQKKEYYQENKGLYNSYNNNRKALRLQATPSWVDMNEIKQFYINRPQGMEIDHIYPLQSDWVCGLHTIENLQYLSKLENRSKYNRRIEIYHNV